MSDGMQWKAPTRQATYEDEAKAGWQPASRALGRSAARSGEATPTVTPWPCGRVAARHTGREQGMELVWRSGRSTTVQ